MAYSSPSHPPLFSFFANTARSQETYLFQAACSELSTEVRNNRRATDEVMREQRMRLQHEADVIGQTLNHELLTLNDTVRGLFDDRKMAVREEQKANAGSVCVTFPCSPLFVSVSPYTNASHLYFLFGLFSTNRCRERRPPGINIIRPRAPNRSKKSTIRSAPC